MRLEAFEVRSYRLPYRRPVRWFNSAEDGAEFVALRLFAGGARGVAETAVKPTWAGLSPRAFAALVADVLAPALAGVDLGDVGAVQAALSRFPGNPLAKALVLNARASLAAHAAGVPLWRALGGAAEVEISWCITRQPPEAMAAEAAAMVAAHGFRVLKVKGGQGRETDLAALRAIRAAVGPAPVLTVDANGAYAPAEAADYVRMLADEGVAVAEDPCPLAPDAALARLVADSPLPILVDSPCVTAADAAAFLAAGARAISVKPGRIGIPEAETFAGLAAAQGASICSGMYAESALGSLSSFQAASALPRPFLPAEQSFYLLMAEQILGDMPQIRGGRMTFGDDLDIDSRIDWSRTDLFAAGQP